MTKSNVIKWVGTALSFIAGGGAATFIPAPYNLAAAGIAGVLLGWLHLPQLGAK